MNRKEYIQEVREGIAERLRSMITASHYNMLPDEEFYKRISEILSDPRIAIVDSEQSCFLKDEKSGKTLNTTYEVLYVDVRRIIPKEEYIKEV